jgi:hypothetical protein
MTSKSVKRLFSGKRRTPAGKRETPGMNSTAVVYAKTAKT